MDVPVITGIYPHPEIPGTTLEIIPNLCLRNLVCRTIGVIEDTYPRVKQREALGLGCGAEANEAGQHGEGEEEVADGGTDFRDFHVLYGVFVVDSVLLSAGKPNITCVLCQ